MFFKNLPVSGFEPRTSGIRSDSSANWATTTAQNQLNLPVSQRVKVKFWILVKKTKSSVKNVYQIAE